LHTLGLYLEAQSQHLHSLDDLEDAIEFSARQMSLTPDDPYTLLGLATKLLGRYGHTDEMFDLDAAIATCTLADARAPETHIIRPSVLLMLSRAWESLYDRTDHSANLESAITAAEQALHLTPPNEFFHTTLIARLGDLVGQRYNDTDARSDLDLSTELTEAAMKACPPDRPLYTRLHLTQGIDYTKRYTRFGELDDLKKAEALIEKALALMQMQPGHPSQRMYCASETASMLVGAGMWEQASRMADEAVMLLPSMSPRSLERRDQQRVLGREARLAPIAAMVALRAGRGAGHALRMLEFGRGVMLGYIIDNRSDISNLRRGRPELADRFEGLRRALDPSAKEEAEQEGTPIAAAGRRVHYYGIPRRQRLLNDIDELLREIRRIEGYEGFLLPPGEQEMMKLAESGPVVVVLPLVSSYAIIITTTEIKSISLPKLDDEGLDSVVSRLCEMWRLVEGPIRTYDERNKKMGALLLWLWDAVVEPILEELQIHAPPPEIESNASPLPHIWWIGVSFLGAMPFHAAGDHSPGSNRNTISRVVSSYIPTLKALAYARQRDEKKNLDSQHSILLVTMDTTPGEGQLKKVTNEAANLKAIAEGAGAKATVLPQPSASRVLDELQRYDVVHFACHGVTDSADPSKSALLLLSEDGNSVSRLLVEKVADINSLRARLAYLSACKTADSGKAIRLADENIHLAGAFQLAGFAHVVATMWTGGDRACMEVAEDFYKGLYRVGGHGNVGREVHAAVRKLREKKPGKYLQWAPFIHTG
ncbi:hypothetical protein P167DRAFT_462738, partial [Morchella conica CCBAS932]